MNCPTISLNPLKVAESQAKDVLRCLIHTIVFQRFLAPTTPQETECEVLDVTYCKVSDVTVESRIEDSLDKLWRGLRKKEPRHAVIVAFYTMGGTPSTWFSKPEKAYWEYWMINLLVVPDSDASSVRQFGEQLERDVVDRMKAIVKHTDAAIENNHVPPLKDAAPNFEITSDHHQQSWPSSLMEWVKSGKG
eukprot:EG_transcript_24618